MTSYGDVRKIIEDVVLIAKTLKTFHNAEKELEELSKETQVLSRLANDINQNDDGFQASDDLKSVFKETDGCISDLKQHLEKRQRKIDKFWGKVVWLGKKNGVEKDLEKAHRLKDLLSQMNANLTIRDISNEQKDTMVDDFIKSWTPIMTDALLKASQRVQVTEGTGKWIYNNQQFKDWERSQNGLLWINGLQGCGKTGLAITIDDQLRAYSCPAHSLPTETMPHQHRREQSSPAILVATVFCYHQIDGMRQLHDHMEILMSLWVQLVRSKPACRPNRAFIKESKNNHQLGFLTGRRRMEFQRNLLKHALNHSGDTVLILDGLDEIPRKLQFEVISDLRSLQTVNDRCRILATSRPYESITKIFKNDPKVNMEAPDVDLLLYMEERFSRHDWDSHNEFQCHDIIEILLPKCRQSFLLCQLIMDEVVIAESKAHCERIISQLPSTVDEAYSRGLNRLKSEYSSEGLVNNLPCMAIQALFWVAYAKSPMTGDQLAHALGIADSTPDSDFKVQVWRDRGIDSRTGRLVVIDPENGELVMAHETLTRYLTKDETRREFFPRVREHMYEVQLKCLLVNHNRSRVVAGTKDEFFDRYPLIPYAVSNWGKGLERILERDTCLWRITEEFLGTSFHSWNDVLKDEIFEVFARSLITTHKNGLSFRKINPYFLSRSPGSINGLYWLVLYDLQSLVPFWVDHQTECLVQDPIPTSPLGFAAALNNTPMMSVLLQNGAQVNFSQQTGIHIKPPLHDAVWHNNALAAKILLESGADITTRRGDDDKSPLDLLYNLARLSAKDVVSPYIASSNGTRAQELQFLVRSGHLDQLEEAIRRGMDINHPCENGKRALDYALEMGNPSIIKVLRENGALSNLSWLAKKTELCPHPVNLREPTLAPLVTMEKEYEWEEQRFHRHKKIQDHIILEIPINNQDAIRSIVFETITADRGDAWEEASQDCASYISGNRSPLEVALLYPDGRSQGFVIQDNVHASETFRLHTNIWNLSEIEVTSPFKAKLMRDIKKSSVLQIFERGRGPVRQNLVKYIRVRLYSEEIYPDCSG